jgi:hypothetical protein
VLGQGLGTGDAGGETPRLRVIRGDATPEEIAALVVALATRPSGPAARPVRPRANWRRPSLRTPLVHGPGAWRASALPHQMP